MGTDTRAVVGIGSAPKDESQGVRLVRPLGPTQGRPLVSPAAGATIAGRVQAVLLATVGLFSKKRRATKSDGVLELGDADLVAPGAPPPLPSVKGLQTKLAQPDVHAFFMQRK